MWNQLKVCLNSRGGRKQNIAGIRHKNGSVPHILARIVVLWLSDVNLPSWWLCGIVMVTVLLGPSPPEPHLGYEINLYVYLILSRTPRHIHQSCLDWLRCKIWSHVGHASSLPTKEIIQSCTGHSRPSSSETQRQTVGRMGNWGKSSWVSEDEQVLCTWLLLHNANDWFQWQNLLF